MSEFAGNLPRKFINFRHLGFESRAHKFLEERESENPQNVVERDEANTVEIGETSASPAKSLCSLQDAPVRVECIGAELRHEDRNLTMAEKDWWQWCRRFECFVDHVNIIISSNVCFFHLLLLDNWWDSCVQLLMRVVYYGGWVRYNILSDWCVICPLESWLF